MDPLTHGLLGASVAVSLRQKSDPIRRAAIAGALAALSPDLDVLIQTKEAPILEWVYHRHFTHSLLFIPVGAWIIAFLLQLLSRQHWRIRDTYVYCLLGYATHGLLDACTSYGTQLFWPFTNMRISWDIIAIIDPLFTLPLLFGLVITLIKLKLHYSRLVLLFCAGYLMLGFLQHQRALSTIADVARSRGHHPERLEAKPTVFNNLLWRGIYIHKGLLYFDAVQIFPLRDPVLYLGQSVTQVLDLSEDFPRDSKAYHDFQTFKWFTSNTMAWHPERPGFLADMRYSTLPNSILPIWGVLIDQEHSAHHLRRDSSRQIKDGDWKKYWQMILGKPI